MHTLLYCLFRKSLVLGREEASVKTGRIDFFEIPGKSVVGISRVSITAFKDRYIYFSRRAIHGNVCAEKQKTFYCLNVAISVAAGKCSRKDPARRGYKRDIADTFPAMPINGAG